MVRKGKRLKPESKLFSHDVHFNCDDGTLAELRVGAARYESISAYVRHLIHDDYKKLMAEKEQAK